MTRLFSAMRTDVLVQVRNNLYSIGIGVGILVAVVLSQVMGVEQIPTVIPVVVLLVAGGSTMLYVAGMIIFEKDEGTINAVIVTPLRASEYLWSKIVTLTTLGTLEAVIMAGGAVAILWWFEREIPVPNIPILFIGAISMGVIYTLFGIVMVVRYNKITDFLVPVVVVASILQLPFVHFLNLVVHPAFLAIPSSAPTMLMQGAFSPLETWEWIYAVGYTAAQVVLLTIWAYRAFDAHVVQKVG